MNNEYFDKMKKYRISVQDIQSILESAGIKMPTRTIHWRIAKNFGLELSNDDTIKEVINQLADAKESIVKNIKKC
jgi:hypothetical protein